MVPGSPATSSRLPLRKIESSRRRPSTFASLATMLLNCARSFINANSMQAGSCQYCTQALLSTTRAHGCTKLVGVRLRDRKDWYRGHGHWPRQDRVLDLAAGRAIVTDIIEQAIQIILQIFVPGLILLRGAHRWRTLAEQVEETLR